MTAQKPRNRIVVFRLSQDEFTSLQSACVQKGGRNLSEFTRSELLNLLSGQSGRHPLDDRLHDIDRRLSDLQTTMQDLILLLVPAPLAGEYNDEPVQTGITEGIRR